MDEAKLSECIADESREWRINEEIFSIFLKIKTFSPAFRKINNIRLICFFFFVRDTSVAQNCRILKNSKKKKVKNL